jgi:hypothetical protein
MRSLVRNLLFALCAVSVFVLVYARMKKEVHTALAASAPEAGQYETYTLHDKGQYIRDYAAAKGFNTTICFLIDMRLHSGLNRFYVYNMKRDSVMAQGMVAHGRCNQRWLEGRQYGNEPGCGCTSLGKYKIGKPYQGKFGLAYKLYGLDSSNDNAFKRFVVLHAHECVPDVPVYPDPICQSDGCPTVAPAFLSRISKIIDASDKPVLLLIFN